MSEPILIAKDLHKRFGSGRAENHVLRGLSLTVNSGEFVAVMGPSGCGKSTLLHMLGLMSLPDDGDISLDGQVVNRSDAMRTRLRREKIGFVFQRFNLLPTLSARDNIRISLKVRGVKDNGQVSELLKAMNVEHVASRKPGQMSIGEQQRVAVARALAHQPAILLADEPTGNLDSKNTEDLLNLLREIHRQRGQTLLMITHSPQAADAADRIMTMKDGIIA